MKSHAIFEQRQSMIMNQAQMLQCLRRNNILEKRQNYYERSTVLKKGRF